MSLRRPIVSRWISRRSWANSSSAAAAGKRIDDFQVSEYAAILQILAEEGVAAGVERGRDDQRVVESETVIPRNRPRRLVKRHRQRQRRLDQGQGIFDRLADLVPALAELAARDRCELVEHLDAEDAASRQ